MGRLFLNKRAMTLVEVLIVSTVIIVLIGAGTYPYIMQQNLLKKQLTKNAIEDEASIAMAYIARDLYRAKFADVNVGQNQLTLTVDTQPGSTKNITYAYVSGDKKITRQVNSDSAVNIASDISVVNFIKRNNNYVEVLIKSEREDQAFSLRTAIALRATQAQ